MNDKIFTSIVEQTKGIVLSAIKKYLFERYYHAIDDVVQETYLRAYKSLMNNKFQGRSKTGTWLYIIAKNESLRMNHKLQREEKKKEKIKSDVIYRKHHEDKIMDKLVIDDMKD